MKNIKKNTFCEDVEFQLEGFGKSKVIISNDLCGLKSAIIYKEEYNEIAIIQECDSGDSLVYFLDELGVSALKEILK